MNMDLWIAILTYINHSDVQLTAANINRHSCDTDEVRCVAPFNGPTQAQLGETIGSYTEADTARVVDHFGFVDYYGRWMKVIILKVGNFWRLIWGWFWLNFRVDWFWLVLFWLIIFNPGAVYHLKPQCQQARAIEMCVVITRCSGAGGVCCLGWVYLSLAEVGDQTCWQIFAGWSLMRLK